MSIDKLTLVAGSEISVPEIRANVHQPTIREISIIGEEKFYLNIGLFSISKEKVVSALTSTLTEIDIERIELVKTSIGAYSDFELLLQVLNEEPDALMGFEMILSLVLPDYTFSTEERFIIGFNRTNTKETITLTEENYPFFKNALYEMFCLGIIKAEEFNTQDDRAKAIAAKIKKARERVRLAKGEGSEKTYILANYISSLGIGSNALNILNAVDLTVYQLFNQMERFGLYVQNDYAVKAAMAGAKGVEMIDWLKNI